MPLATIHIGRLGELLVQQEFLEFGIDSAPLPLIEELTL